MSWAAPGAASGHLAEQFKARAVGVPGGYEPSGGRAEDELEPLAALAPHFKTLSQLVHSNHRAGLERASKVGDSRARAHAREWLRWSEHASMLGDGDVEPRRCNGGRVK